MTNEALSGWSMILTIMGLISIGVVIVLFLLHALFRYKRSNLEGQLQATIIECREIESRCTSGCAVFHPEPRYVYLFDILVSRGTLMRNPLGGYSFRGPIRGVWDDEFQPENIVRVSKDEYEEEDEVSERGYDENGELVPFMIDKMIDGKLVACPTEDKIRAEERIRAEREKEKENGNS